MKIAFVILQYMAWKDTLECVESIRKHVGISEYKIIIVDNCSPDDSYEKVNNACGMDDDIMMIHSESNLGFAKGNNLGYQYALKHYRPEYIIMLNNDVLLIQDDIYKVISDCYRRYEFAVMGPLIYTADGLYTSSPMLTDYKNIPDDEPVTKEELLRSIKEFKKKLFLIKIHLHRPLKFLYQKFLEKDTTGGSMYFEEHVNYRLHGSFMIFSKKYQNKFPEGLDKRTFMYDEEYFLQYHVMKAGMKLLYSPRYSIYHKEDASTDSMMKTYTKKAEFQMKGMVQSRTLYIQMLEDGEE